MLGLVKRLKNYKFSLFTFNFAIFILGVIKKEKNVLLQYMKIQKKSYYIVI